MTVYGYVRVSTDRQADEGESLGTQERQIAGYAMQRGWTVAEIFVEAGVSGSTPLTERPEGARLLAALAAGDTVITPRLDRMFRSALDALAMLQQLKDREVSLHMIDLGGDVTGNGVSKLVFTILAAVAEGERDRIRERIRDVKRDQAQRGRFLGGKRPFGYRVDTTGIMVEDAGEQAAIVKIRQLRAKGDTWAAIQLELDRDGVALSQATIRRIAARPGPAVEDQGEDRS